MARAQSSKRLRRGSIRQGEHPDWRPLELLLRSDDLCSYFMWMFDVELDDGTVLNAYKHQLTRCYFHLADDASTFYFAGEKSYGRIDPLMAILAVFRDWDQTEATLAERFAFDALLERFCRDDENEAAAD